MGSELAGAELAGGGLVGEAPALGKLHTWGPPEGYVEIHWEALCLLLIVLFGVACC